MFGYLTLEAGVRHAIYMEGIPLQMDFVLQLKTKKKIKQKKKEEKRN